MPHTQGSIVIKVNLGMEDNLRDKDMTMDEDGEDECSESDMTEAPETPGPNLSGET